MQNSFSNQYYPIYSENTNPNIFPTTSLIKEIKDYDTTNYQTFNSFYEKNLFQKKNPATFLTTPTYEFKTLKPGHPYLDQMPTNKPIYNSPISYKEYSLNTFNHKNTGLQRYNSSGNFNVGNIFSNYNDYNNDILDEKKTNLSLMEKNDFNDKLDSNSTYVSDIIDNNQSPSIPFGNLLAKDDLLPRQTINQYEDNTNTNINYTNNFFINENISGNYNNTNNILNNALNEINNSDLNSSFISALSIDNNLNNNYIEDEPSKNFKLSDFIMLNQIGEGAEGTIYNVQYKKNNKNYALKKCEIIFDEEVKKKKSDNDILREFIETTGCDGVIKLYGNLCTSNEFGTNYYYELMELAEKNWDKEIEYREKNNLYYQEYELMDIFSHLIKTFSALQSIHFTHRDINPQNIMMANGKWKICDFGNSKILKRDGIIIQRIRGSEIFMSPILFKGYHSGSHTIRHNTFKSDVFSLGMCFLLAASLKYGPLNVIREVSDMNIIKKIVNKYLGKRYSKNLIGLLLIMLQVEEKKRPDFKELELYLL